MEKDPPSTSTTTFRKDLRALIRSVKYDGDFYSTQKVDATLRNLPVVEIDGIGRLMYPIDTDYQVQQIVSAASQAPVGVGEDTVVDQEYRKTWQLDANQVKVTGYQGDQWLKTIVSAAAQGLGLHNEQVEANLHKLLLYEEGSFFKSHRDSQKEPGMFATLAIQLPSSFQGGSMKFKHLGVTKKVTLEEESQVCLRWTAWYADCYHENEPLTGGHRIALIYNLVRTTTAGTKPQPPLTAWDYTKKLERLRGIVQKWQDSVHSKSPADKNDADSLEFFESNKALSEYRKLNDLRYVHKLDHSYSVSCFPAIGDFRGHAYVSLGPEKYLDKVVQVDSWESLKGRDRNIASLFCAFGGPLKVRFVVQDIISVNDDWDSHTACQTTEIRKQQQPDRDDETTSEGPVAVALDVDKRGVYNFSLYQSNEKARDAYDRIEDLEDEFPSHPVAEVQSVERFGNEGQPRVLQYRVGYLILELRQE